MDLVTFTEFAKTFLVTIVGSFNASTKLRLNEDET